MMGDKCVGFTRPCRLGRTYTPRTRRCVRDANPGFGMCRAPRENMA